MLYLAYNPYSVPGAFLLPALTPLPPMLLPLFLAASKTSLEFFKTSKRPSGLLGKWQTCAEPGRDSVPVTMEGGPTPAGGTGCFRAPGLHGRLAKKQLMPLLEPSRPLRASGPHPCSRRDWAKVICLFRGSLGVFQNFGAQDNPSWGLCARAGWHQVMRTKC